MAFRRLTWHRSWALVVIGAIVGVAGTVAALDATYFRPIYPRYEQAMLAAFGVALGLLMIARGLTGAWTHKQLAVDVPAGRLRLPNGTIHALDELGPLAMTTSKSASRMTMHELRVEAIATPLYDSFDFREVVQRHTALERAVLRFRLRRALEAPQVEGDAFRAGPDLASAVEAIAADSPHVRAELAELTRDHDPTIRERATQLLASADRRRLPS